MKKKLTKKQKEVVGKYDATKAYTLEEAAKIVQTITYTKFDASVDLDIRLGVDPKKANQMVRGIVTLPHGTGKTVRVLVLCTPDKEQEAKDAGAEHVGLDDYIQKIEQGWTDVDIIITMPSVMGKVGKLGKVLGPRNLMPNPKTGTVTTDIAKAVKEVKAGKIDFKVDKQGIIHASVAKVSFDAAKIAENANELLSSIAKLKPASAKGTYMRSVFMSSTMSPGVMIETRSLNQ
jgi:large subunit ribosomal protein L1